MRKWMILDEIILWTVIIIVCLGVIGGIIYYKKNSFTETYTEQGVVKSKCMWSEGATKKHTDKYGNIYYEYTSTIKYSTVVFLPNSNVVIEDTNGSTYRKYDEGNTVTVQITQNYYKGKLEYTKYEVK